MAQIVPDDKDWTWTLDRRCPDCGFVASDVPADQIAPMVRRCAAPWATVLQRPAVRDRPRPEVWSPLEYACHVRDVCRVFEGRVRLMLGAAPGAESPKFANWDQDQSAVDADYAGADAEEVAVTLAVAARSLATAYDSVAADQWDRGGVRSDGATFTVLTLGRYCLHDLAHHLWDVGAEP